mgnify:CR=1 FL=1
MDSQEQKIFDQLKEMLLTVKPTIKEENITENALLIKDMGMDSLTMLLMILSIESTFNLKIIGNPGFNSVIDVINYIKANSKNI